MMSSVLKMILAAADSHNFILMIGHSYEKKMLLFDSYTTLDLVSNHAEDKIVILQDL
jgi:hypothetical protein